MRSTEEENGGAVKRFLMRSAFVIGRKPIWRWTQFTLLVVGLALLVGFAAARLDSYLSYRSALKTFADLDQATASVQEPTGQATGALEEDDVAEPDFSGWSEGRVDAYKKGLRHSGDLIGVLQVPALHLLAPLLEGTDGRTLNRGVGRIAGTAQPGEEGNLGIAGHRDSFFRSLKDIKTGDSVELKTRNGMDVYVVEKIQIVAPRDVSVLREHETRALTLVTCYPFYFIGSAPQRFIVTAFHTQHIPVGQTASVSR